MNRILTVFLFVISGTAMAHGPRGYWHQNNGGWNWMTPALIGGIIGYEISRPPVYTPPPIVVQQPPVIIQQPPIVVQGQNCSPWTQIQNPDGTITSTRTCTQ